MTHGDKAKAGKAASQTSGNKKSSSKTGTSGKELKGTQSAAKGVQTGGAKKQAGGEKAAAAPHAAAKADVQAGGNDKASIVAAAKIKARPAIPDASGFTNPVVSSAFKRALKKFPNAFRRLTD